MISPATGEPQPSKASAFDVEGAAAGKDGSTVGSAVLSDVPPLYTLDEFELAEVLPRFHRRYTDPAKRAAALGRHNVGQPYEIYLLGEYPSEHHDPDPIYCFSRSDCVTFSEHMYAMALADNWWDFLAVLQRIRYRDGIIGMASRNHFTLADWDRNNAFLFEDITRKVGQDDAVSFTQTCRRARYLNRFGIGQNIPDETIHDAYIPTDVVAKRLDHFREGDFVNIIRASGSSVWAGHVGMIALGENGSVNLLHSSRPAVRIQPLVDYLRNNRRCVGIKVLRLRPHAEKIMRRTLADSPNVTAVDGVALSKAVTAWRKRYVVAPGDRLDDWHRAMPLQAARLGSDATTDTDLQAALTRIDQELRAKYGIEPEQRAVGVWDLTDLRLAWLNPERMFRCGSVIKLAILLAYFDEHPDVSKLDPSIKRKLARMIKVSDNAPAIEFGRQLGTDKIQSLLQSSDYEFYDEGSGMGFWYGGTIGSDDNAAPHSGTGYKYAATVRQVLRYYLMLEQGRLISPPASRKMMEAFLAPELEHHQNRFVKGLSNRDVTVLRKTGTEPDHWYADTARVEHDGRVYLLAGFTHHPKGEAYLADLAAAIDTYLCSPPGQAHQLKMHESAEAFRAGTVSNARPQYTPDGITLMWTPDRKVAAAGEAVQYESPVIRADRPFNEVIPSWNVDAPPSVGFVVDVRARRADSFQWTPYLRVGRWGPKVGGSKAITECPIGRVDVDYFRSKLLFDRVQYRIRAAATRLRDGGGDQSAALRIDRVALCLSDTRHPGSTIAAGRDQEPVAPVQLNIPFRSQRAVGGELASRICSPTSVSMVLDHYGIDRPTVQVARRLYDPDNEIYGNWGRAVQGAYSYGVPGYVTRINNWQEAHRFLANGQPLIISITVEEGKLPDAPYRSTNGHLLVMTGFDENGDVRVNDPAVASADTGQLVYDRDDLARVWLGAKHGLAYVLMRPEERRPVTAKDADSDPLVDLRTIDPRIVIDLRYATTNNFTHQRLYDVPRCLLRESVARRLSRVQDRLVRKGLGLKIYDGYRPLSVQRIMWKLVPDPRYVADPSRGSRHNRGAAVDVTLVDATGRELEMPTGYDDFTPAAHRDYGGGTTTSRQNRDLLAEVMQTEGFLGLSTEWWHFDAAGWRAYPLLDQTLTHATSR